MSDQPTHPADAQRLPQSSGRGRWIWIGSTVAILIIIGAAAIAYASFLRSYDQRIYPGVSINGIDVSGLSHAAALARIDDATDAFEDSGVTVRHNEEELVIESVVVPFSASGDDRQIFAYDNRGTVDIAYHSGRSGNWWQNTQALWGLWRSGRSVELLYTYDPGYVEDTVQDVFGDAETQPVNANITLDDTGELTVVDGANGNTFDYESIVQQVESRIMTLNEEPVTIGLFETEPVLTREDVEADQERVTTLLREAPVRIEWTDAPENTPETEWLIETNQIATALTYATGSLALDPDVLREEVADIVEAVERDPQEGKWRVLKDEGGAFTGLELMEDPEVGRAIQMDALAENIILALDSAQVRDMEGPPWVALELTESQPTITTETVQDAGIQDLLGTGHSDMSGSPANRRGNIQRGIDLLDGLVIPAGEEFSLLDSLKPFTISNGYVPELVIKGNETIPEIGGGLCQVGTTTFRGAMEAGLDITSRRNHSYAVSYYSDDRNGLPGTDATIYDIENSDNDIDFTFLNDTPAPIILQTRLEGNHLYFDFWGRSDGREATFTAPVISGWVQPPPVKEIPTKDLAPGERDCTESAHAGTTASFNYVIQRPNGEEEVETFRSYYKPWQAVCLVGEEPEESEESEETEESGGSEDGASSGESATDSE